MYNIFCDWGDGFLLGVDQLKDTVHQTFTNGEYDVNSRIHIRLQSYGISIFTDE